jgi:uncharacterized protein (DUF2252 family)
VPKAVLRRAADELSHRSWEKKATKMDGNKRLDVKDHVVRSGQRPGIILSLNQTTDYIKVKPGDKETCESFMYQR